VNVGDITIDLLESYAEACRQLQAEISRLGSNGFNLLVVPSRGAHPFLQGARGFDMAQPEADLQAVLRSPFRRMGELYLPFTADLDDDSPILSRDIRSFWSRMLAAMIRREEQDVACRFHRFLRARAGGLAIGDNRIPADSTGKFVFVDTVVSGKAISEIFAAFEMYGLKDCHFILLVDECGRRIKSRYASALRRMVAAGRATVIDVEKIFTEDQGPAMSGIWTVSFPEIMIEARRQIPELARSDETGACLYYHEVSRREDGSNLDFTISNGMLGVMINTAVIRGHRRTIEHFLDEFRKHVSEKKLQRRERTKQIADAKIRQNIRSVASLDVSSSHVIRVRIGEVRTNALIKDFLGE
jgi:hypothetical protein